MRVIDPVNDSKFMQVATDMAALVSEKNAAYGNSFEVSSEFLKTLWPEGVPPESFPYMLTFVRIFDKMKRIATAPDAFGEDPVKDILGYAILLAAREETVRQEGSGAATHTAKTTHGG